MHSGRGSGLSREAIGAYLADSPVTPGVYVYDAVDSTNAQAKRLLAERVQAPLLVVANEQTAGRGRLGRTFYSPADTGVYMTLALRVEAAPLDVLQVTTAAAVAVVCAIEALTQERPQIKWVNDVYLHGRKLCGILAEAVTDAAAGRIAHVIVGIGINVSTVSFPGDLSGAAISLHTPGLSRIRLIAAVAERLLSWSAHPASRAYMDCYRAHSMVIGQDIRYCRPAGAFIHAKALGVDDDGGLIVQHADGSRAVLRTGEITLRLDPASS